MFNYLSLILNTVGKFVFTTEESFTAGYEEVPTN